MGVCYNLISGIMPIVCLGYMLHNLSTRQGRVAELTLPASNVERFVWHVAFWLIAPMLTFFASVLVADLLQLLLSVAFGCSMGCKSLFLAMVEDDPMQLHGPNWIEGTPLGLCTLYLSGFCFTSTFALGNAWKYRYNIIYTILAHAGFWITMVMVILFLGGLFTQIVSPDVLSDWLQNLNFSWDVNPVTVCNILKLVCFLFNLALLVGIWALTYRLYCRAQITSRRNK